MQAAGSGVQVAGCGPEPAARPAGGKHFPFSLPLCVCVFLCNENVFRKKPLGIPRCHQLQRCPTLAAHAELPWLLVQGARLVCGGGYGLLPFRLVVSRTCPVHVVHHPSVGADRSPLPPAHHAVPIMQCPSRGLGHCWMSPPGFPLVLGRSWRAGPTRFLLRGLPLLVCLVCVVSTRGSLLCEAKPWLSLPLKISSGL